MDDEAIVVADTEMRMCSKGWKATVVDVSLDYIRVLQMA